MICYNASEDRAEMLERHLGLGKTKAISYLPIRTIEKVLGLSVLEYKSMIEGSGNRAVMLSPDDTCIDSGAIYAYSELHLRHILNENAETLRRQGWPLDPELFIRRLSSAWLGEDDPLIPVVKASFGD